MMWRSSKYGRPGLLLGAWVWLAPISGWTGAPKNAPDEATLSETNELKWEYERLYEGGKYRESAAVAERACSILAEEHGSESAGFAACLNDLATLYFLRGAYRRAEAGYERALAIRKKVLGPERPEVAQSLNGLATLYQAQGVYGKAELLYKRALAIRKKTLGPNHPDVAASLRGLASLREAQGAYEKAEPLYERALAILEKSLGPDHSDVAMSIDDLATLYQARGEYGKAEPLLARALAISEKTLGSDHPEVATAINNLAALYVDQGAYGKAEPLYERALAISEKTLGPDHPNVATDLNNLGSLYDDQGAYGKAEPLYERALAIREKALGPDHPHVALSLNNLASLHADRGAYGRAEPLLERALAIREKALGPDHPDVAQALNNLAFVCQMRGAYGKAESLNERALGIYEKALGPDHPYVALSLNNLAILYFDQGDSESAKPLVERALAIREKALGPDHPLVATTLTNLALLHKFRGAYGKAEVLNEQALAVYEKALGPDHPLTAQTLNNLASLYHDQGAFERAEPLYEQALAVKEKVLGPEHPDTALSLNNLAELYVTQGEYRKAEPLFERALAIYEKVLGPDHPNVAVSLNNLATLYHDQGSHDPAAKLHRRALDIEETNLARTLTVADESRRLAYTSQLSGSLHYALSLLRVNPEHDLIAELALTTLLRRKNRVQDRVTQSTAALRRSLPEDGRHLLDDLSDIDSRVAVLSSRGPGGLTVEEFARQLDELQKKRDRLWNELAKHSVLVEALDHPTTIEDVQRSLSVGSVLVELVHYVPQHDDGGVRVQRHEAKLPPRYAAYLVFPDRFDWVDLGPAAPIDEHIKTFRKAVQTKQAIPTELYDVVMRPIIAKLGSAQRLIIAPAGDLSLIPFGALYDGERYLVEKYELRYVTTGRDLLDPPASPAVTTTPVTVIANPTGAFLPDAETEADFLEDFFPDTRLLRGKEATETNVRTVERPLILHMATHGFFGQARNERDNPMFRSGLHLADIEQVQVDRELDDGQLTAYEVSGMDLRGTQLVVLSACDTGMGTAVMAEGKVLMSEGVSGLRRAFAMAGARTTVMSLWAVSGVTAQTTMEAYYRKLAEGRGPGEAMQAVQLEMLRIKEHAHPKDWAVFIVSGDDKPLDFPIGQEPRGVEEEPPEIEGKGGCATKLSGRRVPTGSMLIGLLGLTALRRRGR